MKSFGFLITVLLFSSNSLIAEDTTYEIDHLAEVISCVDGIQKSIQYHQETAIPYLRLFENNLKTTGVHPIFKERTQIFKDKYGRGYNILSGFNQPYGHKPGATEYSYISDSDDLDDKEVEDLEKIREFTTASLYFNEKSLEIEQHLEDYRVSLETPLYSGPNQEQPSDYRVRISNYISKDDEVESEFIVEIEDSEQVSYESLISISSVSDQYINRSSSSSEVGTEQTSLTLNLENDIVDLSTSIDVLVDDTGSVSFKNSHEGKTFNNAYMVCNDAISKISFMEESDMASKIDADRNDGIDQNDSSSTKEIFGSATTESEG